jgi:site-specific DNA-methyltransferase (adenine-specific)
VKKNRVKSTKTSEKIESYIHSNNIKVGKNRNASEKSHQIVLDIFSYPEKKTNGHASPRRQHNIPINLNPFFQDSEQRISIFHDDAINFLRFLPSASVDLIVTDPAYSGMNQRLKLGRGKIIGTYANAGKKGAKWFEEFHDTEENYKTFLAECYRVLKDNRHIYIMFDSYSLLSLAPLVREVFEVKNIICWDKANIGLGHYFRRRHEFILFASKGKRHLNSKNIPDVWKIKRVNASKYPTQKPTEIFELMIKGSAEKNFIVCDPFLGSGSAAIAALKL